MADGRARQDRAPAGRARFPAAWAPNLTPVKVDQICSRLASFFASFAPAAKKSWPGARQAERKESSRPDLRFSHTRRAGVAPAPELPSRRRISASGSAAAAAEIQRRRSRRETKVEDKRTLFARRALCSLGTIKHAAKPIACNYHNCSRRLLNRSKAAIKLAGSSPGHRAWLLITASGDNVVVVVVVRLGFRCLLLFVGIVGRPADQPGGSCKRQDPR